MILEDGREIDILSIMMITTVLDQDQYGRRQRIKNGGACIVLDTSTGVDVSRSDKEKIFTELQKNSMLAEGVDFDNIVIWQQQAAFLNDGPRQIRHSWECVMPMNDDAQGMRG